MQNSISDFTEDEFIRFIQELLASNAKPLTQHHLHAIKS
ncbi:bacteriocin immunity protein [Pseudomonas sp. MRSN 12121]